MRLGDKGILRFIEITTRHYSGKTQNFAQRKLGDILATLEPDEFPSEPKAPTEELVIMDFGDPIKQEVENATENNDAVVGDTNEPFTTHNVQQPVIESFVIDKNTNSNKKNLGNLERNYNHSLKLTGITEIETLQCLFSNFRTQSKTNKAEFRDKKRIQ